jgi:adenosylcobyric acid synthase
LARHDAFASGDGVQEVVPGLAWQSENGQILGTYVHGLFEDPVVLQALFGAKVPTLETVFDGLADFIETHMDTAVLARLIGRSSDR